MRYRSSSSANTRQLGRSLAATILARGSRRGAATVVALSGELGSGKTTFAQGFLRALGVRGNVASPTFILMRPRAIRHGKFRRVVHVDVYRLRSPRDLAALGWKKIVAEPTNLIIIEWADRIRSALPKGTTWVTFHHGRNRNERIIRTP